jgi:hypothetical protein
MDGGHLLGEDYKGKGDKVVHAVDCLIDIGKILWE